MDEQAVAYLADLQEERPPTSEPEEDQEWADAFLAAFRRMRDTQRGKEIQRAAERFGQSTAADRYRFSWEFWQNAEDARATELTFEVGQARLLISNNGQPFTSGEVFSLLTLAASTKDEDDLGQFGIGSLALMGVCDAPIYRSGHYSFRLDRSYTYPAMLSHESAKTFVPGTVVECSLRPDVDSGDLYAELVARASEETLLYMRHLQRVLIRRSDTGEEQTFTARKRASGAGDLVTVAGRTWHRFQATAQPPPGMRRVDGTPVTRPVEITLVRRDGLSGRQPVIAFFPTKQTHLYPWRFSARFDVTNSREAIHNREFNRWLLRETGKLMVRAAASPGVGHPHTPWTLVPMQADPDDLLGEVAVGAFEEMAAVPWLPGPSGAIEPAKAIFAASAEVRSLFASTDLSLIGLGERAWIRGVPSTEAGDVLVRLGAERACCHKLSALLALGRKQPPDWYLKALSKTIDLAQTFGTTAVTEQLILGRSVLDRQARPVSLAMAHSQNRVVCNATSENVAQELTHLFPTRVLLLLHKVYRITHDRRTADPLHALRRSVDEWLASTSSPSTFLYETRLDAAAFIKRFIVDTPPPTQPEVVSDRLLDFVRDHLEAYISDQGKHRRDALLNQLGMVLLIKAQTNDTDGKKRTEYRPIGHVQLSAGMLDRAPWATAAQGVPGFWWADWHYRKTLVRPNDPLGVAGFLRTLGARNGPVVEAIPMISRHGHHDFIRVTRGNPETSPNFPHDQTLFSSYSEYGLVDDYASPDLDRWWQHVQGCPPAERSKRSEALLRMFEDHWEEYENHASAAACGYASNAQATIGRVPTRWLWFLQHRDWVLRRDGVFKPPTDTWARTDATSRLLGDPDGLSQWPIEAPKVARELGFRVDVPATLIIQLLQRRRDSSKPPSIERARAWYEHLASSAESPNVRAAVTDRLIYAPGAKRHWWSPAECLSTDDADAFEGFCGDLRRYPSAKALWSAVDVPKTPDRTFLAALWRELPRDNASDDKSLLQMLSSSYEIAENKLLDGSELRTSAPVVADQAWHDSSRTFSTRSEELAEVLREHGLFRWDFPTPAMRPRLQSWLGILQADSAGSMRALHDSCRPDSAWETHLHSAALLFGRQAAVVGGDTWSVLEPRIREILTGRVQVCEGLRLHTKLSHPQAGEIEATFGATAFHKNGNVLLSAVVGRTDATDIAEALVGDLPLSVESRWGSVNALCVFLAQEQLPEGEPFPQGPGAESVPDASFWESDSSSEDVDQSETKRTPTDQSTKRTSTKDTPPPPAVDSYEKESDSGSETGESDGGGLEGRPAAKLKKPRKKPKPCPPHDSRQWRPPQTTEQRAVELYRTYVLDPEGIEITDQRLHAGVGADLVGTDQIFRELKTFTGSAGSDVGLTEHEYKRAGEGKAYELVIVEHVWDQPTITIVRNPLKRLRYYPTGGVRVRGWLQLQPPPRVIQLAKPKKGGSS